MRLQITTLATLLAASAAMAGNDNKSAPIPFSEIGLRATADYIGDALSAIGTAQGARLHCGFQKLEGWATAEGLWLESTATGGGRFRLVATAAGRAPGMPGETQGAPAPSALGNRPVPALTPRAIATGPSWAELVRTGTVTVADKIVRYV